MEQAGRARRAASNDTRVRSDGLAKIMDMVSPFNGSKEWSLARKARFREAALNRTASSSARLRSLMCR